MKSSDIVEQASALLQRKGRVTYHVLKRAFELDDESLEDLKEQLIEADELPVDKDGKNFVWMGGATPPEDCAEAKPVQHQP